MFVLVVNFLNHFVQVAEAETTTEGVTNQHVILPSGKYVLVICNDNKRVITQDFFFYVKYKYSLILDSFK